MQEANKYMFVESILALVVAYILNFAVMSCFAELFYSKSNYVFVFSYKLPQIVQRADLRLLA